MAWTTAERSDLSPVVDAVIDDLEPVAGRRVLVLCSAEGDVAFRLAQRNGDGDVIGLELSDDMRATAHSRLAAVPGTNVRFEPAVIDRIPFPDGSFDGLVSEFIVYPTTEETRIGQPEMARVLRPGGVMSITDVVAPTEPPEGVRQALVEVGLEYLCVATPEDFGGWMEEAGMRDVVVEDLTSLVARVWERKLADRTSTAGTEHLLGSGAWRLGEGVRYIKVRGTKPD